MKLRSAFAAILMAGGCFVADAASWKLTTASWYGGTGGATVVGTDSAFEFSPTVDFVASRSPLLWASATARPQPAVAVQLLGPFLRDDGFNGAAAIAELTYSVTINAPAGTMVPVLFSSSFGMEAMGAGFVHTEWDGVYVSMKSADAELEFSSAFYGYRHSDQIGATSQWQYWATVQGSANGSYGDVVSSNHLIDGHWDGSLGPHVEGYTSESAISGQVSGVFMTGSSFDVTIGAQSYLFAGGFYSYIDPYFHLDAEFVASHPDVSIVVEPYIGNAAAVPEPSNLILLVAGLAVVSVARRVRPRRRVG